MTLLILSKSEYLETVKSVNAHGTAKWRLMKDCEIGGGIFVPRSDTKGEKSRPGIPPQLKSFGQKWSTSIATKTIDGLEVSGWGLKRVA